MPYYDTHRDLGGGAYKRADAGGRVGLGTEPAHAFVLARLDTGVQVVRVKLVDSGRTSKIKRVRLSHRLSHTAVLSESHKSPIK